MRDYEAAERNEDTFPQRSENARIDYFIQSSNYERSDSSVQQHPANHVLQRRQQDLSGDTKPTDQKSFQHLHQVNEFANKGKKFPLKVLDSIFILLNCKITMLISLFFLQNPPFMLPYSSSRRRY